MVRLNPHPAAEIVTVSYRLRARLVEGGAHRHLYSLQIQSATLAPVGEIRWNCCVIWLVAFS